MIFPSQIEIPALSFPLSARYSPTVIKLQYKIKNMRLIATLIPIFPFLDIIPRGVPNRMKMKQANGKENFLWI